MKPVETCSFYPAIASIVEETINLLQGEENPYPYKRWNTLRKKVNVNRSAQLMDRAITKASMTTYGKTFTDLDDKSLQNHLLNYVMNRKTYLPESGTYNKAA